MEIFTCCPQGGYQDLEAVVKLRCLHLIIVVLQHSKQRQSMAEKRVLVGCTFTGFSDMTVMLEPLVLEQGMWHFTGLLYTQWKSGKVGLLPQIVGFK